MKKFLFNLQTLLEVRVREEDWAKQELAVALAEIEKVNRKIANLKTEVKYIEEQLVLRQKKSGTITNLTDCVYYLEVLQDKILCQQDERMRLQNVAADKRAAVIEASKKRKALEKLKDKQYAEWEEEYNKQEVALLDESGNVRYIRQKGVK
jgi:flagellar FliJ protein